MDRQQIREQMKTVEADGFVRAHTKTDLEKKAKILGADLTEAKTKQDIYDAMVAVADLPDPSLRGKSKIENPVAFVWEMADQMQGARRKDVMLACVEAGVAFYTARTQIQSWFAATDRGRRRLADMDPNELPEALGKDVANEQRKTEKRKGERRKATA